MKGKLVFVLIMLSYFQAHTQDKVLPLWPGGVPGKIQQTQRIQTE